MFDIDKWQEIFYTINKNRLRSFLTAFSVSWGIFMLMLLLGAGNGLQNGVYHQFQDEATNSISISARTTSLPYKGLQPGRNIRFTNQDYQMLNDQVEGLDNVTGLVYVWGETTVRYGNNYAAYPVRGVHNGTLVVEQHEMIKGRFINKLDIDEKRKVAVIGKKVAEAIFTDAVDPLGKYAKIGDIRYKVVGVYDDSGDERETENVYIPISTAQIAYGRMNRIDRLQVTTGDATVKESVEIEEEILRKLSDIHIFDPEDKRAVSIFNRARELQQFLNLFFGIKLFLWVVGLGTIIAGIVGVSNIMLITVKERTKEIGVRKALGATPRSITSLFLQESIFITVLSGYIGLLIGIGIIELVNFALNSSGADMPFFRNPEIDLNTAISATVLLIIAGTLAGYFPARRASKIQPIDALRDE